VCTIGISESVAFASGFRELWGDEDGSGQELEVIRPPRRPSSPPADPAFPPPQFAFPEEIFSTVRSAIVDRSRRAKIELATPVASPAPTRVPAALGWQRTSFSLGGESSSRSLHYELGAAKSAAVTPLLGSAERGSNREKRRTAPSWSESTSPEKVNLPGNSTELLFSS
jgi:hypothetical protein